MIKRAIGLITFLVLLSGCAQFVRGMNSPTEPTSLTTPPPAVTSSNLAATTPYSSAATDISSTSGSSAVTPGSCELVPAVQPPKPEKTFGPNELDAEYGLHVTGRPQWIDMTTYRLKVTGLVDHPLSLTYDELRCMPSVTDKPDLICPGVFSDKASWTGVPIKYILELAGVQKEAAELTLVSADGYQVKVPLETASADDNYLAYEVNGKPLPVQHGFPVRAVFPTMWGSYWLKWLVEIKIS